MQALSPEPDIVVEQVQHQLNCVGSAQTLLGFVAIPTLKDTLARILYFMEDMYQAETLPITSACPQIRDEAQQVPIVTQPMEFRLVMSIKEQKILGRFIRLGLPMFSCDAREDAHEFLVSFQERLHNIGLVESHGIDNIVFELEVPAKQWWRYYLCCREAKSYPLTWA